MFFQTKSFVRMESACMFKLGLCTFVILYPTSDTKYFGFFRVHQRNCLSLGRLDLYLHVNEISFSYEWIGIKTCLVKEAKSHSEMKAYS